MSSLQSSPGVTPYPVDMIERYVSEGLWRTNRIEDLLASAAATRPDEPAVIDESGTTTHSELLEKGRRAARVLAENWVAAGDDLVLQMPNTVDAIAILLGCFRLGARPVLALHAHRAHEIAGFVEASRATHWVLGDLPAVDADELVAGVRRRLEHGVGAPRVIRWRSDALLPGGTLFNDADAPRSGATADELAFFQLSGGTTGASKLIPRAHREYAYSFLRSNEICGVDATTVMVIPLPLTHNFPLSSPGLLGVLAAGGCVVVLPDGDPTRIRRAILRHGATHVVAVPPLVQALLDSPGRGDDDYAGLQRVLVGGARLAPAVAQRIVDEIGPLQQVYGMAEGLVCYTDPADPLETVISTQGRPMSSRDEIRVVDPGDPASTALPDGAVGELQVRGPYTIRGYYFGGGRATDSFTADGFYRTGDLVRRDAGGSLTVVGRVKEQINRGGEKIAPAEVENALLRHPGVHDACVLGEEDDILGERTIAYVVARQGATDTDRPDRRNLRAHLVHEELAPFKIPDSFRIVQHLPNTAVGKVARHRVTSDDMLDVIGVGFGPANMALAVALREAGERRGTPWRAAFFEAAAATSWHAGLLFEDASMQVAFAKDLATMRNPRSAFSFMQFLAERGRLADFINRGSMAPLRIEFAEYLKWAADALAADVAYSSRVEAVTPVLEDGVITSYDVDVTGPAGATRARSRHVVLATGLQPVMPACLQTGGRAWHSGAYLARVGDLDPGSTRRIAVIGGGQSAAEVLLDVRERFPEARIHSIHSRFGLTPSDASPFANQIFDPGSVDLLYQAPEAERTRIDLMHANTNDSVVSPATLQELFDTDYRDKWLGRERFLWHRTSRVVDATDTFGGVRLLIHDALAGADRALEVDAVICATGYRPQDPKTMLGDADSLHRDAAGRPMTTRRYQACFRAPSSGHLFLIGQTRHQHGVSATLLSNAAVRAGEITDAIMETEARRERDGTPGCAVAPVSAAKASTGQAPARGSMAEVGAA